MRAIVTKSLGDLRLTTISLGGNVDRAMLKAMAAASGGTFVEAGPQSTVTSLALRALTTLSGQPLREVTLTYPEGLGRPTFGKLTDWWPGEERLLLFRMEKKKL